MAQFVPDVRRLSELAGEDFGRTWGIEGWLAAASAIASEAG